jgi:hypothetical protein
MANNALTVNIEGEGYYINKNREILPYLKFSPVLFNNRQLDKLYINSWPEADSLRLSPTARLMLTSVNNNEISVKSTGSFDMSYSYPRPRVCPVCGQRELNIPFNNGSYFSEVFCKNKHCGHNEILILWKFVRFALQIPYLTYIDIYNLYVDKRMSTATSILETIPERYQNLGYSNAEAEEIYKYLNNLKTIKATSLIYSLLPDKVNKRLIYKLNTLYTSETIGPIVTAGVELDSKITKAINAYNKFFTTPLGKQFMKLNLIVEKNQNPIENAEFSMLSPELDTHEYLRAVIDINTNYETMTEKPKQYVITSNKDVNNIKNKLFPEDFVTKFNIPLPKDIIAAIDDNPIVLEK